jgi:hypothetical protein
LHAGHARSSESPAARSDCPARARDATRLELIPDLGEALLEVGEFPWAELFLEEAIEARHDEEGLAPALAELFLLRLKAQAAPPKGGASASSGGVPHARGIER